VTVGAEGDDLHALVAGADGILAHLADPIDGALLDAAGAQLRVVSNFAVGVDNIDLGAAAERGVRIGHTPDVLTGAVAEFAIGLVLDAVRRISAGDRFVRESGDVRWNPAAGGGFELRGRTLGVLGAGRIGSAVASIARDGFGMSIVLWRRGDALDAVLVGVDVVLVALPLTDETRHLIGARELGLMQPHAVLVNVSRGPVVDEAALVEALRAGRPGVAALDVYEFEPQPLPALRELDNVVLTPHIASATPETRSAMARLAAENLLAALDGRPMPAELRIS
jgi:glyoxylate reductase